MNANNYHYPKLLIINKIIVNVTIFVKSMVDSDKNCQFVTESAKILSFFILSPGVLYKSLILLHIPMHPSRHAVSFFFVLKKHRLPGKLIAFRASKHYQSLRVRLMSKQTKNRLARIARQCDGSVPEMASKRKESARASVGDFWREKEKSRVEGKVTRRGKKKPKASRQYKGGQKGPYALYLEWLKNRKL